MQEESGDFIRSKRKQGNLSILKGVRLACKPVRWYTVTTKGAPRRRREGRSSMKLIHLSDLHLGKRVNEFSMMEDQKYILKQILQRIDEEQPDGVILAGDIYDKPVPPAEAVELFDEFLEKHSLSEVRKKNFRVVKRALMRYELFVRETRRGMKDFALDINTVTKDTLADIWDFMENEHAYAEEYPEIYATIPEKRTPQPRGKNTLIDCFSRIRTFFIWCYNQGKTINRPFDKFPIEECLYGTPVYITLQERNQLFEADLSMRPQLAVQRDIFVFQTVVGCRVGDFYKLTKKNLVNGALEYIQGKTRNHNPRTVRVPLNDIAKTILERYKDYDGETLLPFISEQKYNQVIKEAFRLAGLNRIVTVLNPLTRKPEQKYLYEVATTHTARKTFIGNMYKKVKDPDLVSSVSGHKEGSKAFRRYREIDEEMKQELVQLLD